MPRRFVRESKFRHVYGDPHKKTNCYENIDVSKNSWDGGSYCAVNSKFLAVVLEGYGGGCFIVLPIEKTGRLSTECPKVTGHKGRVLDIQWDPFNTNVIASAAEDGCIKIWNIPSGGLTRDMTESVTDLTGHMKKVGIIQWHPAVNNVLASAGFDNDLIIWDVSTACPINIVSVHPDIIYCLAWDRTGERLATTCKDKLMRIIDPRKGEVTLEGPCHDGAKPTRIAFVDDNRLATVGSTKMASREICLWNTADVTSPLSKLEMDSASGNMFLFYDEALKLLYVAGKGESTIRYFEVSNDDPYLHFLSMYTSTSPQRGFGFLPKRALDVSTCEIFRFYKLHTKGFVEPISMVVPRKSTRFQPDLYPNVPGDTPSLQAADWVAGQQAEPVLISMQQGFTPSDKVFEVIVQNQAEENIFEVKTQEAPRREEDLRKAFYNQQDEIRALKELLKSKELRIKQLEYQASTRTSTESTDEPEEEEVSSDEEKPTEHIVEEIHEDIEEIPVVEIEHLSEVIVPAITIERVSERDVIVCN